MLSVPTPKGSEVLAVFKSDTSVHAEPFHDSVDPTELGLSPPNTKPEVVVPAAADCLLHLPPPPISAISAHEDPFHCSVSAVSS